MLILSFVANFGPAPPIGSAEFNWSSSLDTLEQTMNAGMPPVNNNNTTTMKGAECSLYLKAGLGEACAGHRRPIWLPDFKMKVLLLSGVENLGAELPTGSKKRGGGSVLRPATFWQRPRMLGRCQRVLNFGSGETD